MPHSLKNLGFRSGHLADLTYESEASKCFNVMCHHCESSLLLFKKLRVGDSVHCPHCKKDTRISEVKKAQPHSEDETPIVIVVNDHHLLRSQPNA